MKEFTRGGTCRYFELEILSGTKKEEETKKRRLGQDKKRRQRIFLSILGFIYCLKFVVLPSHPTYRLTHLPVPTLFHSHHFLPTILESPSYIFCNNIFGFSSETS